MKKKTFKAKLDVVSESQRKRGSIIEIYQFLMACSNSAIETSCQKWIIKAPEGCQ